ncbi:g10443 [Coccomyxa viridis]|uniref:G10443 protein n=1 Tax=Coccomyxa viridis TaxID=1274662 RepID=A0ABP1GBD7_9CHLO
MSDTIPELVASKEHVVYCFDVLSSHFSGSAVHEPQFDNLHCPLFVTWNKQSRRGLRLRGCIGTLEPRWLHIALRDYALTSALQDRRFEPMAHREVASLSCTVSLLCAFERAKSWRDWSVGVHGLIIEFFDPIARCQRSATFLPEVAKHERWSCQDTIDALIAKAGFVGSVTDHLRESLVITRYQSTACSLSYDEYCSLRQPLAGHLPAANGLPITVPA